jgi:hypothetical protein
MITASLILLAVAAGPPADAGVRAAPYATISQEVVIEKPADQVWTKISGFCQVGAWIGGSCVITTPGPEGIGTVRRLFDSFEEVMVAKTARSYTYVVRNASAGLASGTVEVRPTDNRHSRIIYTAVYEPERDEAARAKGRQSRLALFAKLLAGMKAEAEGTSRAASP